MTNERRAELTRAMQGEPDEQAVLFINGWGPSEITCGELRALIKAEAELEETEAARSEAVDYLAMCYRATGSIQTEGTKNEEVAGLAIDAVQMLRERLDALTSPPPTRANIDEPARQD